MNKARRKEIYAIIRRLESLLKENGTEEIYDQLVDIIEDVDFIFSDEEYCMDNIPENFRNGFDYFETENRFDNLKEALEVLNEIEEDDDEQSIKQSINEAIEYLNNATC